MKEVIKNYKPGELSKSLSSRIPQDKAVQILCVGTDRVTGDCLAPLVGTFLHMHNFSLPVYGTIKDPVHAVNLSEWWSKIKDNGFTIAIDASLSDVSSIGNVIVREGPLAAGTATKKDLPLVGDMHIVGIVNMGGFLEQMVLQNTRLSQVWDLADYISKELISFVNLRKISAA